MVLHQEKNRQDRISGQNPTGIPTQLKKRMEDNTALELDDVRIHYNSARPASLGALAYTQGTQVYLGPGQERHLPHELGHVVQQKLGMVRPDTRHESGAMLNTDQALEHQADRIGAGSERIAVPSVRHGSEQVVQRMSVLENVDELEAAKARGGAFVPQIARYKRSGWMRVQELKKYFKEESMKNATVGQLDALSDTIPVQDLDQFYERVTNVADGMGVLEYEKDFQNRIQKEKGAVEAARGPLEAWNDVAKDLRTVLESCRSVEGVTEAERLSMPVQGLEKRGKYKKQGMVDPYFNYKKAALHCIAKKAATVRVRGGSFVGPHIALSVIGKNIYAAINSHKDGFPLQSDDTLAAKIRKAISKITEDEVIGFLKSGSEFELGKDKDKLPGARDVYSYIQQLKEYTIQIADAPAYRGIRPRETGPIHGEMEILDYLQNNGIAWENAVRDVKLNEIDPPPGGEVKRVIWIGGTKVDCVMCHDHFGKANGFDSQKIDRGISLGPDLGRNYVVSSREVGNGGKEYDGTKVGTHLAAKKKKFETGTRNVREMVLGATTQIVASAPPERSTAVTPPILT